MATTPHAPTPVSAPTPASPLPTGRIDTTTQQIKNCVVAALTECGLVEISPISTTERQRMAIGTVLLAGRKALAVLAAYGVSPAKVDRHKANTVTVNLNAVLDELQKEFRM